MKTQTQLADRIADIERLSAAPKNLVNKVFTGKPVDHLSLERVTGALGVETHTVLLTSDETESDSDDDTVLELVSPDVRPPKVEAKRRNYLFTTAVAVIAFGCGFWASSIYFLQSVGSVSDTTTVNFSFAEGKPPRGYGLFAGILISMDTLNMESVGHSIRDNLDTSTAKVSLSFEEPIEYFRLDVSYVLPPDEFLTAFSLGLPSKVTGDLIVKGDIVTSNVPGDNGAGTLIWEGLNTKDVYFEIGNLPDSTALPALVIDTFGFRAVAED
ncbi:MAG: hypothetical protein AB8G16_17590 [Gammaproteobacteria bacterium]